MGMLELLTLSPWWFLSANWTDWLVDNHDRSKYLHNESEMTIHTLEQAWCLLREPRIYYHLMNYQLSKISSFEIWSEKTKTALGQDRKQRVQAQLAIISKGSWHLALQDNCCNNCLITNCICNRKQNTMHHHLEDSAIGLRSLQGLQLNNKNKTHLLIFSWLFHSVSNVTIVQVNLDQTAPDAKTSDLLVASCPNVSVDLLWINCCILKLTT